MSLKIDRVQLEIIIQNDKSRKRLRELEDEARGINKELKKLPENSKEWFVEMDKLKRVQGEMDKIIDTISLTGLSLKELTKRQRELNAIMLHMDPRLPEYKKLEKQLTAVNGRITQLRAGARQTNSSMNKLAAGFNKFRTIGLGLVGMLTGVVFGIGKLISRNADLSDSFADVAKTTNLTNDKVRELYKTFRTFNTRTSNKKLLELAKAAGKLGVEGKKNIEGFVNAADKITVALGEDLGANTEDSIRQIGKIVDVFKVKQQFGLEQGLLKVGSAINALGQASTANEGYIVEFTKRVGGIAPNANISAADTLGLAATLDQLGQTAEVSSTVYGKLMIAIGKDTPYYAKLAGMSVGEFNKLLGEDTNEAFIKVLEGAKSTQGGIQGMAETLGKMGVDGQRSASVLGVLTNNIDLLRDQQALSNKEFDAGTSIINEFNTKNQNLAGNLQKIGKRLGEIFVNSAINKGLSNIVGKFAEWTEIPLDEKLKREQQEVNVLAARLINLNIPLDERNKAYEELKAIQPNIVEGIDMEKVITGKLVENLTRYNEQAAKRIVLAGIEEEEAKIINKQNKLRADLMNAQTEALIKLNKTMVGLKTSGLNTESSDALFKEFQQAINAADPDKIDVVIKKMQTLFVDLNKEGTKEAKQLAVQLDQFYNYSMGGYISALENADRALDNNIEKHGDEVKALQDKKAALEELLKTPFVETSSLHKQVNIETTINRTVDDPNGNVDPAKYLNEDVQEEDKVKTEPWMVDIGTLKESKDKFKKFLDEQLKTQSDYTDEAEAKWQEDQENMQRTFEGKLDFVNQWSADVGAAIGKGLAGNTEELKESLREVLIINLDYLRRVLRMAIFEGTAKSIAQSGFIVGLAKSAALTALLEGGFAGVKRAIRGYYYGGDTGSGHPAQERGQVHADEYVVPSFIRHDPDVSQFLSTVVEPRRVSKIKNMDTTLPRSGFAYGGATDGNYGQYQNQAQAQQSINPELQAALQKNTETMAELRQMINRGLRLTAVGTKAIRDEITDQEKIENSVI
jgi:TP901 family phage tail tape measure protein